MDDSSTKDVDEQDLQPVRAFAPDQEVMVYDDPNNRYQATVFTNRKKTERKVEAVHKILIRSRVLPIRRRAGSPMQSTDRSSRSRTRAAIGRKNRTLHVVQNRT